MLQLAQAIHDLIATSELGFIHWLVKITLPGGPQCFSDSAIISWDGHTWNPYLDPEGPVEGVKQNIACDEKLDTSIKLVNVNHAISDLLKTNDFQGCACDVYLYFAAVTAAAKFFHGECGKPEKVNEDVISIPVHSFLQGPRTKLPSDVFSNSCRFAGKCFADGENCLYDPDGGFGIVDPETELPFTGCPGTGAACTARGMRDLDLPNPAYPTMDTPWDNFAGFEKWQQTGLVRERHGFLGILGRKHYTMDTTINDNFLSKAIPLIFGELKIGLNDFFWMDESDFLVCGGFIGDGKLQGYVEILANGSPGHDMKYPPWFTHGWVGQNYPIPSEAFPGYAGKCDPFQGTAFAIVRIKDEAGVQTSHEVNMTTQVYGLIIFQYHQVEGNWVLTTDKAYLKSPIDVLLYLVAEKRGGLGKGYAAVNPATGAQRSWGETTITDVDGVQRKRYEFNGAVIDQQPAGDVLEKIRKEFSLWYRDYGDHVDYGYISPAASSVYTFSEALHNLCVDPDDNHSLIEIWEKPADDVPNTVHFSFLDKDNDYEKTTFTLKSDEQIARAGKVIDDSIFLMATTNIGQALRVASNYMEMTISGNLYASWESPLMALEVEVGDVSTLVTDLINGGQDKFLVTSKEISPDFSIKFEGRLFRESFYDDTVEDAFPDIIRGVPDNPLRLPEDVTGLEATESIKVADGIPSSEIRVTYTPPDDKVWRKAEIYYRDVLHPSDSWTLADESTEGVSVFILPFTGYRMLVIRARSVSRYGIGKDLDNDVLPEFDLLCDGTDDGDVPDAPVDLVVQTNVDDPHIPLDHYKVSFDAGQYNWQGVHTLCIQANETLPFSDGTTKTSNSHSVSGTGSLLAGDTVITKAGAGWTAHDPGLVNCLAIVTDVHGHLQGRIVVDNTETTVITSGAWYLPSGDYTFRVATDFTKENYRSFLYGLGKDFSQSQRSFSFDVPITNHNLYFRVAALNAFGISDWTVSAKKEITGGIDENQAPKVTDADATVEGFKGQDGTQWCQVTFEWTPPDPAGNFSHVLIINDQPVESGMGLECGQGYCGEGWYKGCSGEYFESGRTWNVRATGEEIIFYFVSVNKWGYYNPNWYDDGDYVEVRVTLTPNDNAPAQITGVEAVGEANNAVLYISWNECAAYDLKKYEIQYKRATTEGGLTTASWQSLSGSELTVWAALSTVVAWAVPNEYNGYWFKFRVRAIDNMGHEGLWGESGNYIAYSGAHLVPVESPSNLSAGVQPQTDYGIPTVDISVNWDNPSDIYYGGCEVWLFTYTAQGDVIRSEKMTSVNKTSSTTTFNIPIDMTCDHAKIGLIPYNNTYVVPSYDILRWLYSSSFSLAPGTISLSTPSLTAYDGVNEVTLDVELAAITHHNQAYAFINVYVCATGNPSNSTFVYQFLAANTGSNAQAEIVQLAVTMDMLKKVGFTAVQGTNYYYYAKSIDKYGNVSSYSTGSNITAKFLATSQKEDGAPAFAGNAEVMRLVTGDKLIIAGWWAPTVYGNSVYEIELQIAEVSDFSKLRLDINLNVGSGNYSWAADHNGTFYIRIRFRNYSTDQWSVWCGLTYTGSNSYATVNTSPVLGTIDTGVVDAASQMTIAQTDIGQTDGFKLSASLAGDTANMNTCWDLTLVYSATLAKLSDTDASNLIATGFTVDWNDYDSMVVVSGTTPASTWLGRWLQTTRDGGTSWQWCYVTRIDGYNVYTSMKASAGASGVTARIVVPFEQRSGVRFYSFAAENNYHIRVSTTYATPAITDFASASTVYVIGYCGNIIGPGTRKSGTITVAQAAANKQNNGQSAYTGTLAYVSGSSPDGTFSSVGSQVTATSSSAVEIDLTFAFTQETVKADQFVVLWKAGSAPSGLTDANAKRQIFNVEANTNFILPVKGLDPFVSYYLTVYAGKTIKDGIVAGSYHEWGPLVYQASDVNLHLIPKTSAGFVEADDYTGTALGGLLLWGLGYGPLTGVTNKVGAMNLYTGSSTDGVVALYVVSSITSGVGSLSEALEYGYNRNTATGWIYSKFKHRFDGGIQIGSSSTTGYILTTDAYGQGTWQINSPASGCPSGGDSATVLTKTSGQSYQYSWQTPHYVPAGGYPNYVLCKDTGIDYDYHWTNVLSIYSLSTTFLTVNSLVGQYYTIILAKLTSGGSNGSATFTGGIITAYTAPT